MEETTRAVGQIQAGKAPGPDGIPMEIFKAGGHHLLEHLTKLLPTVLGTWAITSRPPRCQHYSPVQKQGRSVCPVTTISGISLLSTARQNLWPEVLLNRISKHLLDDVVSESQCGFRKHGGTVDMVFAFRQLQEKCVDAIPGPPSTLHRPDQGIRHSEPYSTLVNTPQTWMPTEIHPDYTFIS